MQPRMRGYAYGADPAPWEEPAITELSVEVKLTQSANKVANKRWDAPAPPARAAVR